MKSDMAGRSSQVEVCIRKKEVTVHSSYLVPRFSVGPALPEIKGTVSRYNAMGAMMGVRQRVGGM